MSHRREPPLLPSHKEMKTTLATRPTAPVFFTMLPVRSNRRASDVVIPLHRPTPATMLFPSFFYNLDRDRRRDALYAAIPYRPEHFALLGHVAISYRGHTQRTKLQLKPGRTPLARGTLVAEVDYGFELDPEKIVIKRLGRVLAGKVRSSTVLWATHYDATSESAGVQVTHLLPPEEGDKENIWLAVLKDDGPVDAAQLCVDFGPTPPSPPPKKRKSLETVEKPKTKKRRIDDTKVV
jgi:hypothetical protein